MKMSNPEIRFVKNKDIDFQKWDRCIADSPFGIVYAYSWFLNRICPSWDALICGDYFYIMPLANNNKFGISYIYQPFFSQQLGVFSAYPIDSKIVNCFLLAIPERFRLTDMKLNWGNEPSTDQFQIKTNTNYHLNLQPEIQIIQAKYNSNTQRNIRKAVNSNVYVSQVDDIVSFIEFTRFNLKDKSPEVGVKHYSALQKVIGHAISKQLGEIYGAYDTANNLVAAAFFVSSNNRSIYLAASSNEIGTTQSAMFLLIDTFIRNNAGKELTLDFEGSNIAGIARFYSGFGAVSQIYYSVHQNRLPKIFRMLKK
jgi:hypothetical protein